MKAEELRIGNKILGVYIEEDENGEEQEFTCVCTVGTLDIFDQTEHAIWVEGGVEREYYDEFRPIPLTEQWLLDFGFGKDDFCGMYVSYELNLIKIIHDNKNNTLLVDNLIGKKLFVEYAHQLQNLYFALTGEELQL